MNKGPWKVVKPIGIVQLEQCLNDLTAEAYEIREIFALAHDQFVIVACGGSAA